MSRRITLLEGLFEGATGVRQADAHALCGPYALDALPPDETRFFEAHLTVCSVCCQELIELQATAGRLGVVAERTAPPSLRERVLTEIDRTRQLPPLVPEPARPPRLWQRMQPMMAPAAAALLVLAAALTLVVARLTAQVDESQDHARRMYALLTALTAQDAVNVPLAGPHAQQARLVVSPASNEAVLLVEGLPRPAIDQAYQLWLIGPTGPRTGGFLRPDAQGQTIQVLPDLRGTDVIGVTLEPADGSTQPSSPLLITGRISTARPPDSAAGGPDGRQASTDAVVT